MTEADQILARAREREAAREAVRPRIDYARMNEVWPKQKAALTRAKNAYRKATGDDPRKARFAEDYGDEYAAAVKKARDKLIVVCRDAVRVWNEVGAWPDDWALFQRALDDVFPVFRAPDLRDL